MIKDILTYAREWLADAPVGERIHRKHDEGCHKRHRECLVKRLVEEVDRLREERRWIPVGERLPEEGVEVLWWCDSDDQDRGVYVGKRDRSLIVWGSHEWFIDADFTHWQPLPPGPEANG